MNDEKKPVVILVAEDDDDDFLLTEEAFNEVRLLNSIRRVHNGEELMNYLLNMEEYADPASAPRPGLILLDLNMPRKDGRTALKEIKGHERLRTIPVIIMTVSEADVDILRSYELGACSYIRKPVVFSEMLKVVTLFKKYWFEIVELPGGAEPGIHPPEGRPAL